MHLIIDFLKYVSAFIMYGDNRARIIFQPWLGNTKTFLYVTSNYEKLDKRLTA